MELPLKHTYIWTDIGFTAIFEIKKNPPSVHVRVYRIRDIRRRTPYYDSRKDLNTLVHDPAEAAVFINGVLKWDGCSNWDFRPKDGDGLLVHFCGKEDAMELGMMLPRLHDAGLNLINSLPLTL